MIRKTVSNTLFATFCLTAAIVVAIVLAGIRRADAAGKKAITAASTKIVRAVNGKDNPICTANVIGTGNDPSVGPSDELTNLSVSCSDDRQVTYSQLKQPLGANRSFCITTLGELRDKNKEVLIVADPEAGNPFHCLLSHITPKQFVAATKEDK